MGMTYTFIYSHKREGSLGNICKIAKRIIFLHILLEIEHDITKFNGGV